MPLAFPMTAQIETPRLLLRVPTIEDLDAWAEMMLDEETAKFIGAWRPEGWPGTEIGWSIVRDRWGQGYATEGATAATTWAFENLGWTSIIHSIDPGNIASQAVARRLGSKNLGPGTLPPPYEHSRIDIWGQSKEDWFNRLRSTLA